ncbi:MAG: ribose 5-phosphate isomerase A, partial [Spirochaeta sp.]|nr:ribose 5-phosphate isomerase A [Spirochaeta sp.]
QLVQAGSLTDILAVSTSFETTLEAQKFGIPLRTMNDPELADGLDLAIDGADEVDRRDLALIKGGGGALTREKLVEYQAKLLVVIVNDAKVTDRLGTTFAVPVECIPDALAPVQRALARLGCVPVLRMAEKKAGPVVTDNGNLIVDMRFDDPAFDAAEMEARINHIPGVLENGIFTGVPRRVFVGSEVGMIEELRAPGHARG